MSRRGTLAGRGAGWASPHNFGIVGGKGSPRKLRQHVTHLQSRFQRSDDPKPREKIMERIGKLMGGSATLWVGGASELEIERRKELAQRTAAAMRAVVKDGALPGGGMSYLACRPALERGRKAGADPDESAAYRILYQALAEPARAIFENAGYDPGEIMAKLATADYPCGFDVVAGKTTDMKRIADSAAMQKMALRNAVLTAGMALTVDVLVHHQDAGNRPSAWMRRGMLAVHSIFPLSADDTVFSLAASPDFAMDDICFAAAASGLYRSRDGGHSWESLGIGDQAGRH